MSLYSYAMDHDGAFPVSEEGASQSLALLIPKYAWVELVCGKTVAPSAAQSFFEVHGTLTEEFCGWGYRVGMTMKDDPRIAILWDKIPLGHNGQRTRNNSREVALLGGSLVAIPASEWEQFMEDQAELISPTQGGDG